VRAFSWVFMKDEEQPCRVLVRDVSSRLTMMVIGQEGSNVRWGKAFLISRRFQRHGHNDRVESFRFSEPADFEEELNQSSGCGKHA